MERRDAVRYLAWILAGAATGACTPLRIVTRSFPAEFKDDPALVTRTLRAFVAAVIPGLDPAADSTRALLDHGYPFAAYAAFFASDLSRRAEQRYGAPDFAALELAQRTAIIADGLAADGTTRKLYRGAIYLTQVATYAGIYDDDAGCGLIDFKGRYRGDAISYENAVSFLPPPRTSSGNCA